MKIRGWSIDGFGHFHDHDVANIGDGITVFHGPNEAGKSTLLAFIRGMLFGFPDRRNREARYEPLRGGRHGGRLLIEVDGEPWTLEREASARGAAGVRVTTPRGEGTAEDLRRALGSADTQLFRSVFAFSLTELQSFDTLSDESARSRIFSAGIAGAGRAARQAITEIGDQADALFKPRGRTQRIPTLLKQLSERRQATADARRAARGYPDLVRTEESCLAEKAHLVASLATARRAAREFEELGSLWPIWNELQDAEARNVTLEAIDAFPPDPERRLTEHVSQLAAAHARVAELRAEYVDAEARATAARDEIRPELATLAPDVVAHYETRDLYRSHVTRLHTARTELAHSMDVLGATLRQLGEGWDERRLAVFDASLPQRDRMRAWGDRLRKAHDDAQFAARDHDAATRALGQGERDLDRSRGQLQGTSMPDLHQIDEREVAVRRLRGRLAEQREREYTAAHRRAVLEERTIAVRLLESESEPAIDSTAELDGAGPDEPDASRAPERTAAHALAAAADAAPGAEREPAVDASGGSRPWIVSLIVAAFGLVVAAILATIRPKLGAVAAALAIVAGLAVAVWLRRAGAAAARAIAAERQGAASRIAAAERAVAAERAAADERIAAADRAAAAARRATSERLATAERQAASRRQVHAARLTSARALVLEAREAAARAEREVDAAKTVIAADAVALRIRADSIAADLDEVERVLSVQRQDAAHMQQLLRAVAEVDARCAGLRDHAEVAGRRAEDARAALATTRREWAAWAAASGLPSEMSPESALDFVPAVDQARGQHQAREKLHAAVDALEADVAGWEVRASALLSRAGVDVTAPGTGTVAGTGALLDAVHRLHARCLGDATVRERLSTAEAELQGSRRKIATATAELIRCEAAFSDLLTEANARDEVDYRSRMHAFAERQQLMRDVERLRRQLVDRTGDDPHAAAFRSRLATGAVGEWAREREHAEHDAAGLEQQHEQAIRSHQDAQRRREELESSADVPKCEADEQIVLTALNDAVARWRTLTLARALTEVTLHDYVRTRQPAVVAHASTMFAAVTEGAYPELRQDGRGEGLSVVTRRGQLLGPEQLSRGTAEQLYLCLRLGLAAEFGSHGAQLPLVMDDVCVNFDPERARAIATVLRDVAVGQQVLFFTCHPTTAAMLRDIAPELQAREMPRYATAATETEAVSASA